MSTEHDLGKQDAKTSNEFLMAACQSAILINGGAATAEIAFLHSYTDGSPLEKIVPITLAIYLAGVALATWSLLTGSEAIETWMISHFSSGATKTKLESQAECVWKMTLFRAKLSLVLFVIGGAIFLLGMLLR